MGCYVHSILISAQPGHVLALRHSATSFFLLPDFCTMVILILGPRLTTLVDLGCLKTGLDCYAKPLNVLTCTT